MPTTITTPNTAEVASCLTTLGIWSYGNGGKLTTAFQQFQEICLITMAGVSSAQNKQPRTPTTATETLIAAGVNRRRGRPPAANKAPVAPKGKSGVTTSDIVGYITANPGVTQTALRGVFPTLEAKVLGRMLGSASRPTKTRQAQIAMSGDGYWPRLTARQAA